MNELLEMVSDRHQISKINSIISLHIDLIVMIADLSFVKRFRHKKKLYMNWKLQYV